MEKDNRTRGKIRRARHIARHIAWQYAMGTAIAAAALLVPASAGITVKAAPVSLEASSAAVYEQTSEESSVMGSLIQGSTFDYQSDVEAEDGSIWRMVTMANGVTGYIRGDIAFSAVETAEEENEAVQPDAVGEENEAAPAEAADAGNEADAAEAAGTGTAETAGETAEEAENTEEEETTGDDETAGEESIPAGNAADFISGVENSREKTYAIGSEGAKIKQRESMAGGEEAAETLTKAGFFSGIDKTLVFSCLVLICAAAAGIFFFNRMKKEYAQLDGSWNETPEETAYRHDRKHERRKRKNRRKKGKKKKEAGREGI